MKKYFVIISMFCVLPCFSMKRTIHEINDDELLDWITSRSQAAMQSHNRHVVELFYPHIPISVERYEHAKSHVAAVLSAINERKQSDLSIGFLMNYLGANQDVHSNRISRFLRCIVAKSYGMHDAPHVRAVTINAAINGIELDLLAQRYIVDGQKARRAKLVPWKRAMGEAFEAMKEYQGESKKQRLVLCGQ